MWQDITVAWRFLLKRPISTAIAVLTLGVTVATSTVTIGVLDQALWRPARAGEGSELVTVYSRRTAPPFYQTLSYPDYLQVRDRLGDALDLAALVRVENTLGGGQWPTRITGELVSGNYFSVLNAKPFLGRLLTADDDRAVSEPVVVLGHDVWRRTFGADPALVGSSLRLGRTTVTVVGVTAPGFQSPAWPSSYWLPLSMARTFFGADLLTRADAPIFQTVGRARESDTRAQLRRRVTAMAPSSISDGWRFDLFPGSYLRFWPAYRSTVAQFLAVFAGLAVCILVIACANLAGLLIARATERGRELAVRQALGASRLQLARRLVAEGMVLTACGAGVALLLVAWSAPLVAQISLPVPAKVGLTFDLRLVIVLLAMSLAASVLFTALSAWKGLRSDPRTILSASAVTLAPHSRVHSMLVVAQVALGCVMLTAGGLLARSAWSVAQVDVGFDPVNAVIGRVLLFDQGYKADSGGALYERFQENLARLPGVNAVALGWHAPVSAMRATSRFTISGAPDQLQTRYDVVGPDYFATLGIAVRAGREFDARDRAGSEAVAIVNEVLASRLTGDALGQMLRVAGEPAPRRVVGVVAAIKNNGIVEPAQPFFYLPLAQAFRQEAYVYLRTSQPDAEAMLRTELKKLDPNVALTDIRSLARQVDDARETSRTSAAAAVGAAGVAVLLALVGMYGVLMTLVEQRRREFAIRSALGASPATIVGEVVRRGLMMTAIGLLLGMVASVQAGHFIRSLLFEVAPQDPLVMLAVPLAILAVSALAWWSPARHASRVNPAAALKS